MGTAGVDEVLQRTQQLTAEQRQVVAAFLKRELGETLTTDDKLKLIAYYDQLRNERELTDVERETIVDYLLEIAELRSLTNAERYLLLELSVIRDLVMTEDFSDRREDWYDDDGR